LSAPQVLAALHRIEQKLGRKRVRRWEPRVIDLDLLDHGARIYPDWATFERWRALPPEVQKTSVPEELILPHPRIQDRAFVLVPLAEVAPDWRHPVFGGTPGDMLRALPNSDVAAIRPI
jgi:2-amino-4-hydroxy-6-hydroxymethyldihydropteridine diphosphokinase